MDLETFRLLTEILSTKEIEEAERRMAVQLDSLNILEIANSKLRKQAYEIESELIENHSPFKLRELVRIKLTGQVCWISKIQVDINAYPELSFEYELKKTKPDGSHLGVAVDRSRPFRLNKIEAI